MECDYQSERHCSKTQFDGCAGNALCDYQSERHCSKTIAQSPFSNPGAITSQNDTAPKPPWACPVSWSVRLPVRTTLLQNAYPLSLALAKVRLPVRTTLLQNIAQAIANLSRCDYQSERHCSKTQYQQGRKAIRAITSQNDTAPKLDRGVALHIVCAITSQNDTAPKRR